MTAARPQPTYLKRERGGGYKRGKGEREMRVC